MPLGSQDAEPESGPAAFVDAEEVQGEPGDGSSLTQLQPKVQPEPQTAVKPNFPFGSEPVADSPFSMYSMEEELMNVDMGNISPEVQQYVDALDDTEVQKLIDNALQDEGSGKSFDLTNLDDKEAREMEQLVKDGYDMKAAIRDAQGR